MSSPVNRRHFLNTTAGATAGLALTHQVRAAELPTKK